MASQTRVKCNTDSVSVLLCWITLSGALKEESNAHVAFKAPAEIISISGPQGPQKCSLSFNYAPHHTAGRRIEHPNECNFCFTHS